MDNMTDRISANDQKPGLSQTELTYFGNWFEVLTKQHEETNATLDTIKNILIFFEVLTIIGLVIGVFYFLLIILGVVASFG